ncbi:hypothetical protein [Streptomyces longwoodensis]|uniref:hypothetical protein n=1 Tax=Streptomyces longwoodensis TaxID=68231 RepID=UPI0033E803E8
MPEIGTLMRDKARNAWGEFRGEFGGKFYLRPVGGGREWPASPEFVRRATYDEAKRLRGES